MKTNEVLYATYSIDELFLHSARFDIEQDIRVRLATSLLKELPPDETEITICFKEPETNKFDGVTYSEVRYFATARIGYIAELEQENERLRARIRALEWAQADRLWNSRGMEE